MKLLLRRIIISAAIFWGKCLIQTMRILLLQDYEMLGGSTCQRASYMSKVTCHVVTFTSVHDYAVITTSRTSISCSCIVSSTHAEDSSFHD